MGLSLAYYAWVRSGTYAYGSNVYLLTVSGGRFNDVTNRRYAVRPALLDCNKLKKSRISRTFGVIARV